MIDTEDVYVPEYFNWQDMEVMCGHSITQAQYDKIREYLKGERSINEALWENVADAIEAMPEELLKDLQETKEK